MRKFLRASSCFFLALATFATTLGILPLDLLPAADLDSSRHLWDATASASASGRTDSCEIRTSGGELIVFDKGTVAMDKDCREPPDEECNPGGTP